MKSLKNIFTSALGIIIGVGLILLTIFLLVYGVRIASTIYPFLLRVSSISLVISLFVLLPLGIFKKSRIVSIYGLYIASFIFGASVWVFSFLVTYFYWGLFWVVIGLFIAGIGVIPLGLIASLLHGDWSSFFNIVLGVVMTYGTRALALHWATKLDEEQSKAASQGRLNNEQQKLNTTPDVQDAEIIDSSSGKNADEMLFCPNCGKKVKAVSKFCKYCGSKL